MAIVNSPGLFSKGAHTLRHSVWSRLTSVGLLFFLELAPAVRASCWDLLLGAPAAFSTKIYSETRNDANFQPRLCGLLPEELIAVLGRSAPELDLQQLLYSEFGIDRIRFGTRFGIGRWPYHVLILEKPRNLHAETLANYTLEFSRFLFEEKRRRLRYQLNPMGYLKALDALTTRLEPLVYPALAVRYPGKEGLARQRFGALRLGFRSLFMMGPGAGQLWAWTSDPPDARHAANVRRQLMHWGMSRSLGALYISTLSMSLVHLPEAFESLHLLYKMRSDLVELGHDMENGGAYDRKAERKKLILKYEARIRQLDVIISAGGEDTAPETLRLRIIDLQAAIDSMREELKKLK